MSERQLEEAKRWRVGRVFCIYLSFGIIAGCLLGMLQGWTGLPSGIWAGVSVGMLVLIAPILNLLVRRGKVLWLLEGQRGPEKEPS
jgi:hypothetical protein